MGKFIGRCVLDFDDDETAEAVMGKLKDQEMKGRKMKVEYAVDKEKFSEESAKGKGKKGKGKGKGGKGGEKMNHEYAQLFMKFLPYEATENDIATLLADNNITPEPAKIKLSKDRTTGESRGIGFLYFDEKRDAAAILEKVDGLEFWGKHI